MGFGLPTETIDTIKEHHQRFVECYPQFVDYCPAVLAYDLGFLNYARQPEILDMVEQLLGPNIALRNSSFFAKPERKGQQTPWHQDGEYWPIRPLATCTVWIAVEEKNKKKKQNKRHKKQKRHQGQGKKEDKKKK